VSVDRRRIPLSHRCTRALLIRTFVAGTSLLALIPRADAATWIEQAQATLTCTGQADARERLALDAPWLPTPLDAKGVAAYFRGAPASPRHEKFRHLTLLAAVAWWADLVNDQSLRRDVDVAIALAADREAAAGGGLLFRQIGRCARTHLVSAQIELDRPQDAAAIARQLAASYPAAATGSSVEDWPLILALRELRVAPDARSGLDELTARAKRYAAAQSAAGQPERADRWFAASTFDSLLDRSRAAEAAQRFDEMSRLQQAAVRELTAQGGLDRLPMPVYRQAFERLATTRDFDLGTVARRDAAFASRTLATYTGLYERLVTQAQSQFVADAREQLFSQYKIDNALHALAELQPALPRADGEIVDTAFRLAQLRSYGRLTLATVSAELARTPLDPRSRAGVERYFSMATQTAVWLRGVLGTLRVADGTPLPDGETLWRAFVILDVFYNETAREFPRYAAFVREKAPAVADLATPHPLALRDFQRRLRPGEAIVATLVTPLDLYVWAITGDRAVMSRQRITERDLRAKIQRLRASLAPGSAGALPPFDATAAYELHQLIFAPVAKALTGTTDVTWYGHGPLGAVPPAVLVAAPPPQPSLRTPADFGRTQFLVDRFAFTALADLSLFAWHRDRSSPTRGEKRFLGVGAPLLTSAELANGPRSKSYDLAGGLDGKALADLPKLPESVDELRGLAGLVGESNATLWLGPEAAETHFVGDTLRGYGVIALATHGFLPGEVRGVPEPALLLALAPERRDRFDGLLTSREVASLQLDAPLVILSACNTAAADGRARGETFTGLAQAFFSAGARSLMVSHWPVMSGAAVQLTVDTVKGLQAPKSSLSRSLQRAMQAARAAGASSPIESHPSFWGPFVIVGDGR
jgi:CHAT domain-containing protein